MTIPEVSGCNRQPGDKDTYVNLAGLDYTELALLEVTRFYLQSYATGYSQSWILGLKASEKYFGIEGGARVGVRLLLTLQEMRFARRSVFLFNAPECLGCSRYLSEHERRFITSIAALRRGRFGLAQAEMMMLCEGHDTSATLSAFSELVILLPQPEITAFEAQGKTYTL
tara:strand:+ start:578 stop:1087 length:510 start_codon:yes stop_codon:yes gene_type:complete